MMMFISYLEMKISHVAIIYTVITLMEMWQNIRWRSGDVRDIMATYRHC